MRTLIQGHGSRRSGFSLLELLVVLTLFTVIAAAVIPVFSGAYAKLQRDHTIRDMVALMKYAQERAIADSVEYRVYLDEDEGRFWLMRLQGVEEGEKIFEEPSEPWGAPQSLPDRAEFQRLTASRDRNVDAHYISFYPTGSCDYATIRIIDDDRTRIQIATKGNLSQFEIKRNDD